MKIGIITFWWTQHNYGQMLQVYALQKYLKKLGHEPFVIKYIGAVKQNNKKSFAQKISLNGFLNFMYRKLNKSKIIASERRDFDEFRKKYLTFSNDSYFTEESLERNPPQADAYICGSDQIWNDDFGRSLKPYLLSFGKKGVIRMSYAASFGKTEFSEETMTLFKQYLPNFDFISVREKSGVRICEEAGVNSVEWACDPTLLLNMSDWEEIINGSVSPINDPHVFIYTLGSSKINDKERFIHHFRKNTSYDVIHASSNTDISGNIFPSIEEWLTFLKTSEFVITNSFHGMIFAFIFKRNFAILPTTGKQKGMNDRIISFLEQAGLEDHIMNSYDEEKLKELERKSINWLDVHERVSKWRENAYRFLDNMKK